jgi:hypothetical protein
LESVKHLLWHGNTVEALERLGDLLMELSLISAHSDAAEKVADGLTEFETYIGNNQEFIPNFGERRRQGETISTAFVESTISQVVSRRFVKKQQMQWTPREDRYSHPMWSQNSGCFRARRFMFSGRYSYRSEETNGPDNSPGRPTHFCPGEISQDDSLWPNNRSP